MAQRVPAWFYHPTLKSVPPGFATLLTSCSHIPPEEQKAHILTVRDAAYEHYPYPCLGRFRFLELDLSCHPLYDEVILPAVRKELAPGSSEPDYLFLDLGMCLGQDIRELLRSGASPARVYGADLRPEFINIGYQLFKDEGTLARSHLITPADVFDFSPTSVLAKTCDGKVGILHICAVFHLFNLEEQKSVARRCLQLLSRNADIGKGKGKVLICGAQVGNISPGEFERRNGGTRYRHDAESWRALWEETVKLPEWDGVVKGIEVESVMEEKSWNQGTNPDGINSQKMIGAPEDGFRWVKWWVWVDFA